MAKKTQRRTEELGYCCIFGYFIANRNRRTIDLARELMVTTRTVRLYKQAIKKREVTCDGYANCTYGTGSSGNASSISS